MSFESKLTNIPTFLVASDPVGLRRLCFMNNLKFNMDFKYDIMQALDGQWYAWFKMNIDLRGLSEKAMQNGGIE